MERKYLTQLIAISKDHPINKIMLLQLSCTALYTVFQKKPSPQTLVFRSFVFHEVV